MTDKDTELLLDLMSELVDKLDEIRISIECLAEVVRKGASPFGTDSEGMRKLGEEEPPNDA
jgi:hypothetical protein